MKTLMVYYSLEGFTKKWCENIAQKAGAELLDIHPVKEYPDSGAKKFIWGGKSAVMGEKPKLLPYKFAGKEYDRIILAYPVWASSIAPPMRSFIAENAAVLKEKELGVIVTFKGSGAEKSINKLSKLLGKNAGLQLILTDLDENAEDNRKKAEEFIGMISGK